MHSLTVAPLLGLLVYSANAAHIPSAKQLGDIILLAQNNLRSKPYPGIPIPAGPVEHYQIKNHKLTSSLASDSKNTSAALLLNSKKSYDDAATSCAALSEKLWSPSTQDFNAGLNSSLSYEVFAGNFPATQMFWIAAGERSPSRNGHHKRPQCQAIDVHGQCHEVNCNAHLPALCTQSAPATTDIFADTSAPRQVAQHVGQQTLIGYRDFYTFQFHGVRFAEEPERFTYSSVYTDATGTNSALDPAPECLQAPNNGSTDCLFLNIWTTSLPATQHPPKKALKPVMVYIYGGGFATGSASNPTNDGGNQASRGDVVVVDIAYRLNTLGFLALDDGVHNGNYWISDLISGLEWVQKYISAFGGDPEQVMIFGESAGAQSVQALLASAKAIGLFRGAIMQSQYLQPYVPLQQAISQTTSKVLNETGCGNSSDALACLQIYNATALINLPTNFNFPVVDGTYLTSTYINLNASAANNQSSSVVVMTGVNRDEEGILIPLIPTTNLTQSILNQNYTNATTTAILSNIDQFPLGTGPTFNNTPINQVFNTTVRIATDRGFHCSDEYTAIAAASTGIWPRVYFYEFNRTYQEPDYNTTGVCGAPITPSHPYGDPELEYFKCHAGDLPLSFGTFARSRYAERDEHDIPFAQLTVDYWTSFARKLDPNPDVEYLRARGYWDTLEQVETSGAWRPLDAKEPEMMRLQWRGGMAPLPDGKQCAVLGQGFDALLK